MNREQLNDLIATHLRRYADLPAGLAHNRALRLVAKAVLRDIYLEAKAWHQADA